VTEHKPIWRQHLPPDCPPESAWPAEGQYYRFVSRPVIEPNDFLSHRERGFPLEDAKHHDECEFGGLSILKNLRDVKAMRDEVPGFAKKSVAVGILNQTLGRLKHTPYNGNSHHTWWIPEGCDPAPLFEVVEVT